MKSAAPSKAFSLVQVLIAIVSVQLGASIAKGLFAHIGPLGATALRIGFAALAMGLFFRPWRGPVLAPRAKRAILAYGAALGLMNMTYYLAILRIPIGVAVALEFTGPLAVAVFASRRPLDFVWALLAIVGIFLLLPGTAPGSELDPLGVALALAAGGFWALYIVFGKGLGKLVPGGRAAALGMIVATLIALPPGIVADGPRLLSPMVVPTAILLALLSSAIPYSLEMSAMRGLSAKTFGILMSLEPAAAALFAFAILGEQLTTYQWAAIACIMAASFGSTLFSEPKPLEAEAIEPPLNP